MMIVPVGQQERETILSGTQSLTEQVERTIGFRPAKWLRHIRAPVIAVGTGC
jgi:hypothetical protein